MIDLLTKLIGALREELRTAAAKLRQLEGEVEEMRTALKRHAFDPDRGGTA